MDLQKTTYPIRTGIGYLDHMMDQINSHAQIGVALTVHHHIDFSSLSNQSATEGNADCPTLDLNRLAGVDQASLLKHVGWTIGRQTMLLSKFLGIDDETVATSRFCCPLDEALVECILTKPATSNKKRKLDSSEGTEANVGATASKPEGRLVTYDLAPFGKYPKSKGRKKIGNLETAALVEFFTAFAKSTGLQISLRKIRGDNGHHIVESTFKAFSRAMRNLLDGTDTREVGQNIDNKRPTQASAPYQESMWGKESTNWKESIALARVGTVERSTKETNIKVQLALDGGNDGISISTGIKTLDEFFTTLAREASMSLTIDCTGDLWVDDHHTAEDVSIAVGQCLTQALGTKAGLNRMWCARQPLASGGEEAVEVTMDLSNRPCLTHNLALEDVDEEMIGDLSVEMLDHVLDSLVVNGRMTVHVLFSPGGGSSTLEDRAVATAAAFGKALKFCAMVDYRRKGITASSKGTLSA